MVERDHSVSNINIFVYFLCLAGCASTIVVLTWAIVVFYYSLMLIHIGLSIGIFVLYGFTWLLCLVMAYRVIGTMRTGKMGSTPPRKKYTAICVLLLVGAITPFVVLSYPSWIPTDTYPHLSYTRDPATTMTVTWYSTDSYASQISYGPSPANMTMSLKENVSTNSHELRFTNLSPNTRYYYSIDKFGKTWSFKTASNMLNQMRFSAFSDVHSMFYPPMIPGMVATYPNFMVATGDLTDYGASNADWASFFTLLSPLATNYSLMTAIGNHDTMLVGTQNYLKYLSMPEASTGTDRYYHFKYNGVNFFCLDLEWGMDSFDTTQMTWFVQELDSVPSTEWIVVYDHCMHISSGGFGNSTGNLFKLYSTAGDVMDYFHDIFVTHHVNLVISGHDHHFEISNWDNVTYAIVGTASTRLDDRSASNNTDSIWYETGQPGFMDVQINGTTCTLTGHLYNLADNTPKTPIVYTFPFKY
jgi:hypothetical protein